MARSTDGNPQEAGLVFEPYTITRMSRGEALFRKEYGLSKNLMTPAILGYYRSSGGNGEADGPSFVIELSQGPGGPFNEEGDVMVGVTVCLVEGDTVSRARTLSRVFSGPPAEALAEARSYALLVPTIESDDKSR